MRTNTAVDELEISVDQSVARAESKNSQGLYNFNEGFCDIVDASFKLEDSPLCNIDWKLSGFCFVLFDPKEIRLNKYGTFNGYKIVVLYLESVMKEACVQTMKEEQQLCKLLGWWKPLFVLSTTKATIKTHESNQPHACSS